MTGATMDFGDGRTWRKSTRSADQGGDCLYVTMDFGDDLAWRKSTRSGEQGDSCLYVANTDSATIGVRDSKEGPTGTPQWYGPTAWSSFLTTVKNGKFDC